MYRIKIKNLVYPYVSLMLDCDLDLGSRVNWIGWQLVEDEIWVARGCSGCNMWYLQTFARLGVNNY